MLKFITNIYNYLRIILNNCGEIFGFLKINFPSLFSAHSLENAERKYWDLIHKIFEWAWISLKFGSSPAWIMTSYPISFSKSFS